MIGAEHLLSDYRSSHWHVMMPFILSGLGASSLLKALRGARVIADPAYQLLTPLSVWQQVIPSAAAASTPASRPQQRDDSGHDRKQYPVWIFSGVAKRRVGCLY